VRDEDLDWEIYHALPAGETRRVGDLVEAGYDPALVEASLSRLERSCLVERRGDSVRPLSFQEALILCCMRNGRESPFCIENGVVKLRTGKERTP
jgi:hypothetical protein